MASDLRAVLLSEMHRAIEDSTRHAMQLLVGGEGALTYPPGVDLSKAERSAIGALALSPTARSALEKLLRDAAAAPLFHLFALLDGVADPRDWPGTWPGATITTLRGEGSAESMWHDDFYGTYRELGRDTR